MQLVLGLLAQAVLTPTVPEILAWTIRCSTALGALMLMGWVFIVAPQIKPHRRPLFDDPN